MIVLIPMVNIAKTGDIGIVIPTVIGAMSAADAVSVVLKKKNGIYRITLQQM